MIRPKVRLAEDWDAQAIQEILKESMQLIEGLDWTSLRPYWIVALHHDKVVGCVQALPGRPIGHLSCLAVRKEYHRHGIGVYLYEAARRLLAAAKTEVFSMTTTSEEVKGMLKRLGSWEDGLTVLMYKRVG